MARERIGGGRLSRIDKIISRAFPLLNRISCFCIRCTVFHWAIKFNGKNIKKYLHYITE